MMFGITIRTSQAAPAFWHWVDRACAFEHKSSVRDLNYAPHLTLARYEDIDPALLLAGLDVFRDVHPVMLVFDRIRVFDTEPMVLWLSPAVNSRLLELQARLHELIGEQHSDPHYRPAVWRPHCTIAASVLSKHRSAAKAFAEGPIEPFELVFDAVDALKWPPVTQIGSRTLSCRPVDERPTASHSRNSS